MARPRELYNTPAPQAMSMMGAGIADAYARAGEIEGRGMQALGQGIAQGITSAASSIAGYLKETKQMESQNKSFENLLKNPAGQKLLGMDEASAEQFLADAKQLNARDQNQMFNFALPNMMQQTARVRLQEMSDAAAMDRTKTNVLGGIAQAGMSAQARQKPPLPVITLDDPYSRAPAPTQGQQPPRAVEFDPQEILPQQQGGLGVSPNDVFYKFLEERNIPPSEFDKWVNSLIPSRRSR